MLTKENLKHEIDQLDDNCLELVFRLLQQFPHESQNKLNPLNYSRPIYYPDNEISNGTAFGDIENAAEYGKQLRKSVMKLNYYPEDDILVIEFNNEKIIKDISLNWNVNIGMTATGVGEIVILNAKQENLLPIELNSELQKVA